ncbi:MAG: diaminopimelate decarboxylase [Gammaproteobacteria bacterium]
MSALPPHFTYRSGELFLEQSRLRSLAMQFGTPLFVYSRTAIEDAWHAYDRAFGTHPHRVCYAVKANSNLGVLSVLARLGSGFDIVSVGELERVLAAGGDPARIVFSGVGKQVGEMERALEAGIGCFNVESTAELKRLNEVARSCGRRAPISLRVNPDVDAQTHPYISTGLKENKFGIDIAQALDVYRDAAAMEHLEIIGIDCHIGSQLTRVEPFLDALDRVLILIDRLAEESIRISHLDVGGGLGVRYADETPPAAADLVVRMLERIGSRDLEVLVEPGRSIVANAGTLLTAVEYIKRTDAHDFAIVDAAMNDLARPSLYGAWHEIINTEEAPAQEAARYDVVGPICETGDFLGKDRELSIGEGSLLAILSAGAYGFTMSSNYNSRPRAAEVLVDGEHVHLVRVREGVTQLMDGESTLPA